MKLGRVILALVILLSVGGCGNGQIRPDVVAPHATAANYPTAEFFAANRHFKGLGIVTLQRGENLSNLNLSVMGYYQGTGRAYSPDCGVDEPFSYAGSVPISIPLSGPATKDCTFGFVISPEYPKEQQQQIVIRSFKGWLHLRVVDNEPLISNQSFVPQGGNAFFDLEIQIPGSYRVAFRGCGSQFDQMISSTGNNLRIELVDVLPDRGTIQTCVLQGVAFLPTGQVLLSWFVSIYDSRHLPLSPPTFVERGGKLEILGDDNVSILALDAEYKIDRKASFKWNPENDHILRALTVGGRSAIGLYSASKHAWVWLQ